MDLDFNNPDCSYSKIIPAKSNTKWKKKVSKQIPAPSLFLCTKVKEVFQNLNTLLLETVTLIFKKISTWQESLKSWRTLACDNSLYNDLHVAEKPIQKSL